MTSSKSRVNVIRLLINITTNHYTFYIKTFAQVNKFLCTKRFKHKFVFILRV